MSCSSYEELDAAFMSTAFFRYYDLYCYSYDFMILFLHVNYTLNSFLKKPHIISLQANSKKWRM